MLFNKKSTIIEERLEDGELPWGWIYRHKEFCDKIQNEYTYFLNNVISSKKKNVKEQYSALKSFVIYLEDLKKLCHRKGECYECWFNEILTSPGYLENQKKQLEKLKGELM